MDADAVTVISVAYSSMAVMPGMVHSLPTGTPLMIVDNGPDDGLRDWARVQGIDCLVPGENLGFGPACNLGAAGVATPFVLFLNPDARLQAGTLTALRAAAVLHPEAAAFGAALQDAAGHVSYKHRTRLAPQHRFAPKAVPTVDTPVPALSGAALMVRRVAFAAVGGFDPAIFLYYEDDDLSLRLRAACGPLIFVPSAIVTHHSGKSSAPSADLSRFKGYHWARSRIYAARKHGLPAPWLSGLRNAVWHLVGPKAWRSAERRAEGRGRLKGVWSMWRGPRFGERRTGRKMFKFSRIDYFRRKVVQDLRDAVVGPRYTMEGTTYTVPRGGPPAPRRAISRGTYEKNERDLLRAHLPRDLPVIELGGSFGIVSHTIRTHIAPEQTLVVVEANPGLIATCAANVGLGGSLARTHVINAALAYGQTRVRFQVDEAIHTSHIVPGDATGPNVIDVAAVTIRSLRADHGITGRYCIVCDIEGAELFLMRGDAADLADCAAMVMELHPTAYPAMGGSVDELITRLADCGMQIVERRADVIAARR